MSTHILNSGQTFCADQDGVPIACPGSGQDAEFSPGLKAPSPRFIVEQDVVADRLTQLHWSMNANPAEFPFTHSEALDHIQTMNRQRYAGFHDWRLPNRRELFSLISFDDKKPALPKKHPFENVSSAWYWTATESALQPGYFWYVHLEGGRMFYGRHDNYSLVWPVRGASTVLSATGAEEQPTGVAWPAERFVAQDVTVLDTLTGLAWLRDANALNGPTNWHAALKAVSKLNTDNHGGRSDWRLPTILELESLVDASQHSPALPHGHPFTSTAEGYWSSTNSSFEPDWAMCLYLTKGAVGVGWKQDTGFDVWPVAGL